VCLVREQAFQSFVQNICKNYKNKDFLSELYFLGLKLKETYNIKEIENFTGYVVAIHNKKRKGDEIREREKTALHLKHFRVKFERPQINLDPEFTLPDELTSAQREVCLLLSRDHTTGRIASILDCSCPNVSMHIIRARRILSKHLNRPCVRIPKTRNRKKTTRR